MNDVRTLMYAILEGQWEYNGEALVFGITGMTLSAQHRLIALVLASQRWTMDKLQADKEAAAFKTEAEYKWPNWTEEPYIISTVSYGVAEVDKIINTIDTGKPRKLADAIYRCQQLKHLKPKPRKAYAKILKHAINMLSFRTGADVNAFKPNRTHTDNMDFWHRHPSLLPAVAHIYTENSDGKMDRLCTLGYLAALVYLMGASATIEESEYLTTSKPEESQLDFSRFNQACDFLVQVASKAKGFEIVTNALAEMAKWETTSGGWRITANDRFDLLLHAWGAHISGVAITLKTLNLEYQEWSQGKMLCFKGSVIDETNQRRHLNEEDRPWLGGIDRGAVKDEEEITQIAPGIPDPQGAVEDAKSEIAQRIAAIREKKQKKVVNLKPRRAGDDWAVDDVAWVASPDGEHWMGTITEIIDCDDGTQKVMLQDKYGKDWEENIEVLSFKPPEGKPKRGDPKWQPTKHEKNAKAPVWKVGQPAWVKDKEGDHWKGRIKDLNLPLKSATLTVENGFQGSGTERRVSISTLCTTQPTLA
jgi:hypothetical protein